MDAPPPQHVHKARMSAKDRRQTKATEGKNQKQAIRGYEIFHMLPVGSTAIDQVRMSSAGIGGYCAAQLQDVLEGLEGDDVHSRFPTVLQHLNSPPRYRRWQP